MGNTVYVTLKVMPESPETDLDQVQEDSIELIEEFEGNIGKTGQDPVAFGLKAVMITFSMDEDKGDTEELEKEIETVEGVQSVQVTDVRRAIG